VKPGAFLVGCLLVVLALAVDLRGADATPAAGDPGALATEGLTSTKEHGVIKVVPEPELADGRLVMKIVAFNRDRAPAGFGPDSIKVSTSAGKQVPLMSMEDLAAQVRRAQGARLPHAVDVFGSSAPAVAHDEAGRPDVGNYTGGSNSMGSRITTREPRPEAAGNDAPKVQQQIADLESAILKVQTIAPSAAAGGQIVTRKINFGRKEEHALRVLIDFNGEQHEFNFAAPPAH
jgi:hypothetical protein